MLVACRTGCGAEWRRTGLPFRLANEACGVLNAATRKYLTADHLWYYPPAEAFVKLADYANRSRHAGGASLLQPRRQGADPGGRVGKNASEVPLRRGDYERLARAAGRRAGTHPGHRNGMKYKFRSLHGSQKPLRFIELADLRVHG